MPSLHFSSFLSYFKTLVNAQILNQMDQQNFSPASFGAQGFQNYPINSLSTNDPQQQQQQQQFDSFQNQHQHQQSQQMSAQDFAAQLQNQASTGNTPQQQHSSLSNSNTPVNTSPSVINGSLSPSLSSNNSRQSSFHRQTPSQNQNLLFNIRSREDIQKCVTVCSFFLNTF